MNEQQRYNTETYLVPVLEAKIAKNEPKGVLDSLLQPCNTHGCVAGDVGLMMLADGFSFSSLYSVRGNTLLPSNAERQAAYNAYDEFEDLFGFSEYFNNGNHDVVGHSNQGTLQQRLDYVNSQLEKHNETI